MTQLHVTLVAALAACAGRSAPAPMTPGPSPAPVADPAPSGDQTRGDPSTFPARKVLKTVTPDALTWAPLAGGATGALAAPVFGNPPTVFFVKGDPGAGRERQAVPVGGGVSFVHVTAPPGALPSSPAWAPLDTSTPAAGAWAPVWGDRAAGPSGMLIKLPAGNAPAWHIHRADYHGVLLAGTLDHHESGTPANELPVGSYWWQPGGNKHVDLCRAGGPDCVMYVYFTGAFDRTPQ